MTRSTIAVAAVAALLPLGLMAGPASGADQPTRETERRAPAFKVSARISADTAVAREDVVKIKGRVKPRAQARGEKVVLQQRLDGSKRWKKSGTAKIRKNGKYVLTDDPSSSGTRFYRVKVKKADGVAAGVSKELELQVYAWELLAWRAHGFSQNVRFAGAMIGATHYPATLATDVAGEPAVVEYTLGKNCTSLRSTYALHDASATGGTGSVTLSVDGVVKVQEPLAIGTVKEDVVTDITDAFRIRFDLTSSAAPAAYAAAADAMVLCTR